MAYDGYLRFGFEPVHVPGYDQAIVGDAGGGYQGGHYRIDLGNCDSDYVPWANWVTVVFLAPVPSHPGYYLR